MAAYPQIHSLNPEHAIKIRLQVDTEQRLCGITMTPPLSPILIRKDT
jgi:hypothetical protein